MDFWLYYFTASSKSIFGVVWAYEEPCGQYIDISIPMVNDLLKYQDGEITLSNRVYFLAL